MPGDRWFLDTNALVALLQGNPDVLGKATRAQWLGVSVINVLEFLGFPGLEDADKKLFESLLQQMQVVDVLHGDDHQMQLIARLRQTRALKLPDAIVLASAAAQAATLLTNDAQLLKLNGTEPLLAVESFVPERH
jgi:tRNA(fMet)-specific endonuclease VapC